MRAQKLQITSVDIRSASPIWAGATNWPDYGVNLFSIGGLNS